MDIVGISTLSEKQLAEIMKHGATPALAHVAGYEFNGYNFNWMTTVTQTRKFKKGFYGRPADGFLWGYNVPVEQNAITEPWIARSDDLGPIKYYPFKTFGAGMDGNSKHANGLVIDYKKSDQYPFWNPVQQTIDYLVFAEPGNTDLLLGISYLRTFLGNIKMGYFALERHNPSQRGAGARFFEDHEHRILVSLAEAFYHGTAASLPPTQIAENISTQVAGISSNRTQSLKGILNAIELVLPKLTGKDKLFSKLNVAERREVLDRAFNSDSNSPLQCVLRDLSRTRVLITSGYYTDPDVQKAIGFIPPAERSRYSSGDLTPRPTPAITPHVPPADELNCDICIIGSGAGGAVIAARAAAAGKEVILVEEGPMLMPGEMEHHEGHMTSRVYKEGGLQSSVDFDMTILQGKCLGGTTVINNLICYRLLDDPDLGSSWGDQLLDRWSNDPGIKAPIDKTELRESYNRVEQRIGVSRLTQEFAGNNATILLKGFNDLRAADAGIPAYPSQLFRKNFDNCIGCGYCNFGCKYGRKLSMLETFLPDAADAGAKIIVHCHARKINRNGSQATSVECEMLGGRKIKINASRVVVACGAIGSTKLLMKSGISNKMLGKHFSFNAATPMFAEFDDDINGYDGVQMGSFIDAGDFILESIFYPPMSFSMTMPGWYENHFERMKRFNKFMNAGVLIGTDHESEVTGWSPIPNLVGPIELRLTDRDFDNLRSGMKLLTKVFFAAGASQVLPVALIDHPISRTDFENGRVDSIIDSLVRGSDDVILSSSHPQGGNPMSDDPDRGVVDSKFRVHGFDNLYVCDASVFPTTIRINPQLTIMAFADYAWRMSIGA